MRFTFKFKGVHDVGEVVLDVKDDEAQVYAEALEELGFDDARMQKL